MFFIQVTPTGFTSLRHFVFTILPLFVYVQWQARYCLSQNLHASINGGNLHRPHIVHIDTSVTVADKVHVRTHDELL